MPFFLFVSLSLSISFFLAFLDWLLSRGGPVLVVLCYSSTFPGHPVSDPHASSSQDPKGGDTMMPEEIQCVSHSVSRNAAELVPGSSRLTTSPFVQVVFFGLPF